MVASAEIENKLLQGALEAAHARVYACFRYGGYRLPASVSAADAECDSPGKTSTRRGWQDMATTDEKEISAWWTSRDGRSGGPLLGRHAGAPGSLVVIILGRRRAGLSPAWRRGNSAAAQYGGGASAVRARLVCGAPGRSGSAWTAGKTLGAGPENEGWRAASLCCPYGRTLLPVQSGDCRRPPICGPAGIPRYGSSGRVGMRAGSDAEGDGLEGGEPRGRIRLQKFLMAGQHGGRMRSAGLGRRPCSPRFSRANETQCKPPLGEDEDAQWPIL